MIVVANGGQMIDKDRAIRFSFDSQDLFDGILQS